MDSENPFAFLGGPDSKIVRFTSGDPMAGVDRDAGNGIYRPGNAAQWNTAKNASGIPAIPVSAHGFQEPSGQILDLVGSHPLTVTGTPSRGVAIGGAATTGIGGSGTTANQFAQATGVGNANTTEIVLYGACVIQQPVGSTVQRMYQGGASNNAFEGLSGSSSIRYRIGGGSITGAQSHTGALFPIVLVRRAGFNLMYSHKEKIKIATPQVPASGTVFNVQFAANTIVGSITVWNYAARFEGAGAAWGGASPTEAAIDQQVRDYLETLGWVVTGYGS